MSGRMVAVLWVAISLAAPAQAFERMQRNHCVRAIAAINDMLPDGSDARRLQQAGDAQVVTGDGWCRMRGSAQDGFETLDWRAEGVGDWIVGQVPPMALELRMDGIDANGGQGGASRPPLHLEVALRQVPEAGMLMVERAELSNGRGDVLAGSLVLERVYLSSLSMMQVSAGSVTFKAGLMQMDLTGEIENPFGFPVEAELRGNSTAQREAVFDWLSALPAGVISDSSRAELMAFAGDLPDPRGKLELAVNSDRGTGLMQVGAAMYRMAQIPSGSGGTTGDSLALLLDGVTIDADWSPSDGQTD